MKMKQRCCWISVLCLGLLAGRAGADDYPVKPIRLIAGAGPGGASDILARALGQKLGASFGRQVIVDNRPGAGQNIAADITAKAAPDGYTIFMAASSFTINPSIYRNLPFDSLRDFAPIGMVANVPNMLVVQPSTGARSVMDLIGLARAAPGKLVFGSGGVGSASHLAGELLMLLARIQFTHVPYKSQGLTMIDLLGGQIQLAFPSIPASIQFVKAGKLTALGVATLHRSSALPDVPTLDQAGIKGYEVSGWYGIIGPARLPKPIVARLNQEINRILQDLAMRETLAREGSDPVSSTPGEFGTLIASDIAKWARVVKEAHVKMD
jgi:tripartite-type tricarboxylate transporter receptor subunit TctC